MRSFCCLFYFALLDEGQVSEREDEAHRERGDHCIVTARGYRTDDKCAYGVGMEMPETMT
jgi:hypothetical protein